MTKVFEVMTRSLATCPPDTRVADVASTMRERDIGTVMVVKDGQLHGIVTDRDLALQALTGSDDPQQAPVHKYMSAPVITGDASWSLERVSDEMAKHQVRRLPIVENGQLTGIISLGDVALHTGKKQAVGKSLQAISRPAPDSMLERLGRGRLLTAFALAASATTVFAMLTVNQGPSNWRKKAAKSALYHTARHALDSARAKVDEAAQADSVRDFRDQMVGKLNDLSAQVTALQPKPKRRHFWIV
jgi:CBS domain-containing protein